MAFYVLSNEDQFQLVANTSSKADPVIPVHSTDTWFTSL